MMSFIEALNHPVEAFKRSNKKISWGLVLATVLINSIFDSVIRQFYGINPQSINMLWILKITIMGVASYIIFCIALWCVCKCFGSKATVLEHISSWGISFAPNILCAIVVVLTEVFFYVFWNSTIWGMLLSIVFVGILIWKTVLYFIYLREFAELKGWRFFGALIIVSIIILALASLNGYVGIKTPVI